MPSLVPTRAMALPGMPDLAAVFKAEQTAATRERVINWLSPLYEQYSEIDVEKAWSTTTIHEELHIPMPTVAAYCSELALCAAMLAHADGVLADAAMEAALWEFLATHIWVYHPDGPRTNKQGRWGDWTRGVDLYRLCYTRTLSGLESKQDVIVNGMQAWLLRLLEEKRGSRDFSVERI